MVKELNLQLETHTDLLEGIALKSLEGIRVSEIIELRQTSKQDEYYNKLKSIYIIHLGLFSLEYRFYTKCWGSSTIRGQKKARNYLLSYT